jgi:hypothetical protein
MSLTGRCTPLCTSWSRRLDYSGVEDVPKRSPRETLFAHTARAATARKGSKQLGQAVQCDFACGQTQRGVSSASAERGGDPIGTLVVHDSSTPSVVVSPKKGRARIRRRAAGSHWPKNRRICRKGHATARSAAGGIGGNGRGREMQRRVSRHAIGSGVVAARTHLVLQNEKATPYGWLSVGHGTELLAARGVQPFMRMNLAFCCCSGQPQCVQICPSPTIIQEKENKRASGSLHVGEGYA